jgi:dipeptidyl aminopeptidase/acylaminoacyl peptidase
LGVGVLRLAGAEPVAETAKRAISETDLFRFVWIADPQISPDGKAVAFVRVTVNDKRDSYDTALWLVDTAGSAAPRPHVSGIEVPQSADGNGGVSRGEPRALTLGATVASGRAASAHPRLVREVSAT